MNVKQRNTLLSMGKIDVPGLLPHLDSLAEQPRTFRFDFGLERLPEESGVLFIRGPRQYGKSTWLEMQLRDSVIAHGPGSTYVLNGDELPTQDDLVSAVLELLPLYDPERRPHRLFIDEITAIGGWEKAVKRLADEGELRDLLVVTTGSKATDLRRGAERLPGRKGRLDRTSWLFTPIPYGEFRRVAEPDLGSDCLTAYLLSGGSPAACAELASTHRLPGYIVEMTRDWILGEFAASGRARASLLAVLSCLHRFGGSPVGQAKLAREAGLANNTVAAGYLELLADLMVIGLSPAWDESRRTPIMRRPAKFPFTNLLAAMCFAPSRPGSLEEARAVPAEVQGRWLEWLVAQEIWRRAARRGDSTPEVLPHWRSGSREIDFVVDGELYIEVKRGQTSPIEFSWFPASFRNARLLVVGGNRFRAERMEGTTIEEFLLDSDFIGA